MGLLSISNAPPALPRLSLALAAALLLPFGLSGLFQPPGLPDAPLSLGQAPLAQVADIAQVPQVAQVAQVPRDDDLLRERIEGALEETGTPGAAVVVIRDGRIAWSRGFGLADVAGQRPATPETLFRVGSISKTFVSMAVLQLVEAGRLRLDQTVAELAPEIAIDNPWERMHPVRIVHLLEHTAGFDDIHLNEYAHQDPTPISLERALAYEPRSRRVRWPPGTHFSYSNGGPPVAARIVEKITGQSFEAYVQEHLLAPLEMPHAGYLLTGDVRARLASGYRSDRLAAVDYWHLLLRPSGSLNASVTDLGHLVEMLAGGGTFRGRRILSPASVRRMLTPESTQAARAGLRFGYGLGTMMTLARGKPVHGHDGGMPGYLSSFAFRPSTRAGYAVLVNRSGPGLASVDALLRADLARAPDPVPARVAGAELAAFAGSYRFATPRASIFAFLSRLLTVEIVALDDHLELVSGKERVALFPAGGNLFRIKDVDEPLLAFVPGERGAMDLETGYLTFSRCRKWSIRLERLVLDLFGWLLVPALSAAVRVAVRKLFRPTGRGPRELWVPLLPILACAALFAWWIPFFTAGDDLIVRYGRITPWSVAAWLLSWAFACATVGAVALCYRTRAERGTLEGWWPAALAAGYLAVILAYLAWQGVVGLRFWSY